MIPILIAVVVAIAGAGVAAALNWEEIVKALKGRKLAVLGERKVGKTSLLKFLAEGSIPEEYKTTDDPQKVRGRRFQLRDLKLAIKDTRDMPGRRGYDWERIIKDADIVFYLLRVDRLIEGHRPTESRVQKDIGQIKKWLDAESRVQKDTSQIKRWLDANPKKFPLFVIGTHCDLTDPDLTTLSADQIGDYEDKVREMPIFEKIVLLGGGEKKVTLILGSLKSEAMTEALVYRLFKRIEEEI